MPKTFEGDSISTRDFGSIGQEAVQGQDSFLGVDPLLRKLGHRFAWARDVKLDLTLDHGRLCSNRPGELEVRVELEKVALVEIELLNQNFVPTTVRGEFRSGDGPLTCLLEDRPVGGKLRNFKGCGARHEFQSVSEGTVNAKLQKALFIGGDPDQAVGERGAKVFSGATFWPP